jgi:hypothetical protein
MRDLNRGWGGRNLTDANSVGHVEIERALKNRKPIESAITIIRNR